MTIFQFSADHLRILADKLDQVTELYSMMQRTGPIDVEGEMPTGIKLGSQVAPLKMVSLGDEEAAVVILAAPPGPDPS